MMQDQLERMHGTLQRKPPAGEGPAERVTQTLMGAFQALQREPRLAEAMVRALSFADRSVGREVDAVAELTSEIVLAAARLPGPPTAEQQAALRVVGHTWHATLLSWLSGRSSLAEVRADLHTAARLLTPAG